MTESSIPTQPAAFSYPGHGPNARIGVAISHGFTGSPLSVIPWAQHLASLGFAVSVPLLPGHGTHWRELARSNWRQWYGSFEEAYLQLAARTDACFVAGLSMGGAIALRAAARHPVPGVVVVNPGLSFYDRRVRIIAVLKLFRRTVVPLAEAAPTAITTNDGDYSLTPLASVHQLKKLFRSTYRSLPQVKAPALVFKSEQDTIVPPSSLAMIKRRLGTPAVEVVRLPNSGHIATLDVDASQIFERSARFFLEHAASKVGSGKP
jgi:carboxylesterase